MEPSVSVISRQRRQDRLPGAQSLEVSAEKFRNLAKRR
jgi:hypothetical protein